MTLAHLEEGCVRQLRHDFRAVYHVSYDEVPADEAVDLILTLPRGSLWRASRMEFGEWTDEEERHAELVDEVERLIALLARGTTEGAQRVTRPADLRARKADAERARSVRERIQSTKWEDV